MYNVKKINIKLNMIHKATRNQNNNVTYENFPLFPNFDGSNFSQGI